MSELAGGQIKKNDKKPKILVGIITGICVCMALLPQMNKLCAIAMVPFLCLLFFYDEFYIVSIIFLFFTEQLIITTGMPIFRIYMYLLFARFVIYDLTKTKFKAWIFPACVVMLLYAVFVLPGADVSKPIQVFLARNQTPPAASVLRAKIVRNYIFDLLYLLVLTTKLNNNHVLCRKVFIYLTVIAVISGLYGIRAGNTFDAASANGDIIRQMASFNDPNYASFFFNVSIFITLILSEYKRLIIKIPLLALFYYFLIAMGSMTGLILNVIGLVAFTVIRYRYKAVVMILVIGVIGTGAVFTVTKIPFLYNTNAVQSIIHRIERQYIEEDKSDLDRLTSGRAGKWEGYWAYYNSQSFEKKLFGGNVLTTNTMDPYFVDTFKQSPHQAYLQLLMCVGAVGTILIVGGFLIKFVTAGLSALVHKDEMQFVIFMVSLAWLVYGMALDYYFDSRFMFFYFI